VCTSSIGTNVIQNLLASGTFFFSDLTSTNRKVNIVNEVSKCAAGMWPSYGVAWFVNNWTLNPNPSV
jgi:hypothetical protein